MKWKYNHIYGVGMIAGSKLAELGMLGWELISVNNTGIDWHYYFKMPLDLWQKQFRGKD